MAVEPADQENEDFALAPVPEDARMSWPRIVNVSLGIAGAHDLHAGFRADGARVRDAQRHPGFWVVVAATLALAAMTRGAYYAAPTAANVRI